MFTNPEKCKEITFNEITFAFTGYEVLTSCRKITFKNGCGYFHRLKEFPALSTVKIHGAELRKVNGEFVCTEDSKFDQEIPCNFFDELLKTD